MLGWNVEKTHASPQHRLGLRIRDPRDGVNEYMYVRADDAVAAGDAVAIDAAAAGSGDAADVPFLVTPTGAGSAVLGVAHVAIPAGYYGFITVYGKVDNAKVASGATAGGQLTPTATAGQLAVQAATADLALAAGSGAGVIAVSGESGGKAAVFVVG